MEDNQTLIDLFLSQQDSENTKATYQRGLVVFTTYTRDKPFADVRDVDLISWKIGLVGSDSTKQTRWTAVRTFFRWLVASGRLNRSPFDAVKAPKRLQEIAPRIPTDEQVAGIVWAAQAQDGERGARDYAIVLLLLNGLRVAEVAGLDTTSIAHVQQYNAHVARVVGKGNKERLVPLNASIAHAVQMWQIVRPQTTQSALFVDVLGRPDQRMTRRQIQQAFDKARAKAGVTGVSCHSLRHHYATRLIRAGTDVFSVQKLMGHASVKTTQVYVNLDLSDTVAASRADPLTF